MRRVASFIELVPSRPGCDAVLVQPLEDGGVAEPEQVQAPDRRTGQRTAAATTGRRTGRRARRSTPARRRVTAPVPSKTWKTDEPTSRRAAVSRAGREPVDLGADRRQDVAAGGGVGEPDRGVPGLDRRRRSPRPPARAGRPARGRCAPSGRPAAGVAGAGRQAESAGAGPGGPTAARSGSGPGSARVADLRRGRTRRTATRCSTGTGCRGRRSRPSGRRCCVVVAVPVPAGLGQEVAAAHRDRVAVDDGPHALALDDEAEGVLGVPVLGGVLARAEVLDRGPQRRGGERARRPGRGWPARSRGARRRARPARGRRPARPAAAGPSQRQQCGTAPAAAGCAGIRSPISVHSGTSSSFSKPR